MIKEYFYTPEVNKPCKRLCDRCTIYLLCTDKNKTELNQKKLTYDTRRKKFTIKRPVCKVTL